MGGPESQRVGDAVGVVGGDPGNAGGARGSWPHAWLTATHMVTARSRARQAAVGTRWSVMMRLTLSADYRRSHGIPRACFRRARRRAAAPIPQRRLTR